MEHKHNRGFVVSPERIAIIENEIEELFERVENIKNQMKEDKEEKYNGTGIDEALDMAIKSLEQPSPAEVLAAVREEIEVEMNDCTAFIHDTWWNGKKVGLEEVLEIIDKHMEELEGEES